ncbi:Gfo/Idh/MocA family protein [Pseudodesulfovibrio hydrargyri]|uniref:Gfo/Idh/MocA family protein n=1 Tax=Pseudodesulfovibrio hydrargyri TaxID=2125990 RepID=UPI001F61342C|nr:gfo/Idh/MocA family oxidoreductase [Pseudodesulfovibrio hydrargyri]
MTGNRDCPFPQSASIAQAVASHAFDLVIISNATTYHKNTLAEVLATGYTGKILVEKPLFETAHKVSVEGAGPIFVAYNLRFHPLVQRTFALLKGRKAICAEFFVGQFLPDWRPGTDYRKGYSAIKEQGGGVLRDLSHELDLVLWMLGSWTDVTAVGGHFSRLEISSDDSYSLLMKTERCRAVSVHLDYLNFGVRRGFNIIAEELTLTGDFIANTLLVNGEKESFATDRDTTYKAQLEALLGSGPGDPCTFAQGAEVVALVDGAEAAAQRREWVTAS